SGPFAVRRVEKYEIDARGQLISYGPNVVPSGAPIRMHLVLSFLQGGIEPAQGTQDLALLHFEASPNAEAAQVLPNCGNSRRRRIDEVDHTGATADGLDSDRSSTSV